tara:strand:+ start:105 stop:968 length:864 start_codon:yes stop_codon:yes gene_type:complete
MSIFSYLSQKIRDADYYHVPFKHLLIEDFLLDEHLKQILSDPQVHFGEVPDTRQLVNTLSEKGYVVQNFPGCTDNIEEYLHHYQNDSFPHGRKGTPIESYGITYRLNRHDCSFTKELVEYLNGDEFKTALEEKFKITRKNRIVTAIQKNLSHYEISPHPDIREKVLTYLLNINKNNSVDEFPIHTHLLKFKPEWEFIKKHWSTDFSSNTTWVPWDWCESVVTTNKNNSIVIFEPSVDTLHAIKMKYDHTKFQRTQLYGNLMSHERITSPGNYKDLIKLKDFYENGEK